MYAYKIKNGKIVLTIECNADDVAKHAEQGFIISETLYDVNITEYNGVDFIVTPIVVPDTPEPTPLTADQIKQQKYAEINMIYSMKLRQISNARVLAEMTGLPTDALIAKYKALQVEWKSKLMEVV